MPAALSKAPGTSPRWYKRGVLVLLAASPFVFLAAFALEPLVQQGVGSFFNWYDLKPDTFAGLRDYRDVFADSIARGALLHTVVYVAITVPLEVGLGLFGAWMVLRVRRGRAVLMALFVVPLVIPWTQAANLFLGFFNSGGVLDGIRAHLFGAHHPVLWFQSPRLAFAVIVLIGTWKGAPWCFLLMFAAISASRADIFEAGRMDGARGVYYWLHVVVPSVWPMLVFVTVFRTFVEAQTYASVALLTQGGPANATQLASTYDQTLAFSYFQFGSASALSTLTGAALLVVAVGGFAVMRLGPGVVTSRALALVAPPGWLTARFVGARNAHRVTSVRRERQGPLWWVGSSKRRAGRANAGVLWLMAAAVLVPLLGGLPGHALQPTASLPWSLVSSSLENSGILTAATLLGTLLLALPAAYLLARGQSRLRSALFVFVLGALAVPGALLLLPQYQEMAWLGLVNTLLGLVLLYIAANLPLAVFFLRAAFASVPETLVESMHVDGASRWQIMTRLFIPLSASTIVTISVFVVIAVFNEVPLAVTLLNSASLYPLPILAALGTGGIGSLGASWLSVGPPLLLFLACQRVFQRGMLSGPLL
jgi:ABC-type sugar transport system permease subunit